jgi:uncharacterized protein YkwD
VNVRTSSPDRPDGLLGGIWRRWRIALFLVGLLGGVVVAGGIGLTSVTDGGDRGVGELSEAVTELVDSVPDSTADYGGGGGTTDAGTRSGRAPNGTPHATGDPLAELEPAVSDPGVSTLRGESVTAIAIEAHIHQQVNSIRRQHGLQPLNFSASLTTHGRAHSLDMYERDYFAHENPDGESPADRLPNAFAHCTVVGENLHYRTWTDADAERIAETAVEAWMDSKTHRENLLRENWTVQGIGVYIGSTDDRAIVYSSQEFCET